MICSKDGEARIREGLLLLVFLSIQEADFLFLRTNDKMGEGTLHHDPEARTVLYSLNDPNGANFAF